MGTSLHLSLGLLLAAAAARAATEGVSEGGSPAAILQSVATQVGDLGAQLRDVKAENERALTQQEADFGQQVQAARQQSLLVAYANVAIIEGNKKTRKSIEELRMQALALEEHGRALRKDLGVVRTRASQRAVATAAQDLQQESRRDKNTTGTTEAEASIANIAKVVENAQSLLQLSRETPEELLNGLGNAVLEMQKQQELRLRFLKDQFDKKMRSEAARHGALLAEQRALNASRATLVGLESRLRGVVGQLSEERTELEAQKHHRDQPGQPQLTHQRQQSRRPRQPEQTQQVEQQRREQPQLAQQQAQQVPQMTPPAATRREPSALALPQVVGLAGGPLPTKSASEQMAAAALPGARAANSELRKREDAAGSKIAQLASPAGRRQEDVGRAGDAALRGPASSAALPALHAMAAESETSTKAGGSSWMTWFTR